VFEPSILTSVNQTGIRIKEKSDEQVRTQSKTYVDYKKINKKRKKMQKKKKTKKKKKKTNKIGFWFGEGLVLYLRQPLDYCFL